MSEHCEVYLTRPAERELKGVAAKDPERYQIILAIVGQVEENGWKLSTKSQVVKVLRPKTCIGEIRYFGSGGYRLFFFWTDTDRGVRELHVCRVLPKRDVEGKKRLSEVCDAVEKVRERFLREDG